MTTKSVRDFTADQARSLWIRASGLATTNGPAAGAATTAPGGLPELVGATGWLRTLGGVDAYLALAARRPSLTRADVDSCIASGTLLVTPAVRNCNFVVPRAHHRWALAEAHALWQRTSARQHSAAGLGAEELESTADHVLSCIDTPMTTAEIRKALPEGTVRSLGDPGKKVGLSSTLPPALRLLEFQNRIQRRPVGDRMDTDTYHWLPVAEPDPFDGDELDRRRLLAAAFAGWCAPFTIAELAAFGGFSDAAALRAVEASELQPVNVEGVGQAWVDQKALDADATDGIDPGIVKLLGFEDLTLATHSPAAWFDPIHHGKEMPVWGRGDHTLGGASHLYMRTILRGDRMAGFWAWDPDTRRVEVAVLDKLDTAARSALDAEVDRVSDFLNRDFGNARMTSIDSESTERSRLDALRSLAT